MSNRTIPIPCGGFDMRDENPLWELLFLPDEELSVREKAKIEEASAFGELYWAEYEVLEHSFKLKLDLDAPGSAIVMEFPNFVSLRYAAICMMMVLKLDEAI